MYNLIRKIYWKDNKSLAQLEKGKKKTKNKQAESEVGCAARISARIVPQGLSS